MLSITIKNRFKRFRRRLDRMLGGLVWLVLVRSAYIYSTRYMDQWEKVKFPTSFGAVYLSLLLQDPYPDSYEVVDKNGRYAPFNDAFHKNAGK